MITFIQTNSGLTVFRNGKSYPIGKDHPNYIKILNLCTNLDSKPEDVDSYLDVAKTLSLFSDAHIQVTEDSLTYDGVKLDSSLAERVISLLKEGESIATFIQFMNNLFLNPSFRAVNELYGFLQACDLPLTSDGCFLAYKKVTWNYRDLHSGSFDNSIGKVVSMPRNQVDENSDRTCSNGLHCCSFNYLSSYGGIGLKSRDDRVIIVKVNPKDVVSIPKDYDNQKMRVCEYTVVDEVPNDGISKIVKWCYGNRAEGWIRDTIQKIRGLAVKDFNLDHAPKYDESFNDIFSEKSITDKMKKDFFNDIGATFNISVGEKEYFAALYTSLSVENVLQFVSNWSD